MAWYLMLQGPTHTTDRRNMWQLDVRADIDAVEESLVAAAATGEAVLVPAVFANHLHPVRLFVRPAAWAAWTIYEQPDEQRFGYYPYAEGNVAPDLAGPA